MQIFRNFRQASRQISRSRWLLEGVRPSPLDGAPQADLKSAEEKKEKVSRQKLS